MMCSTESVIEYLDIHRVDIILDVLCHQLHRVSGSEIDNPYGGFLVYRSHLFIRHDNVPVGWHLDFACLSLQSLRFQKFLAQNG